MTDPTPDPMRVAELSFWRNWLAIVPPTTDVPILARDFAPIIALADEVRALRAENDQARSERDAHRSARDWFEQQLRERTAELAAARDQIAAVRARCADASSAGNHIDGVSVVRVPRVLAALSGPSGQPNNDGTE